MPHLPVSQVLLKIEQALQDSITTDSGLKLYISPDYKREWQASVVATIVALPINSNPKDKKILDQLSVGDEICISYSVVADFAFQQDGGQFMSTREYNEQFREYVNGKGFWVKVYCLPGKISPIWVGVHQDNRKEIIDGVQGSQSQIETWLSQFPIGKTDIFSFNNFFEYNKQDYWKCGLDQIFAKRVKGHLVAVGDRVICKPIDEEVPAEVLQAVQHNSSVKIRYQDRAKVLTGGKEKGIKRDEVVSFNPSHCEKYKFFGKDYYLINQNMVLGKWN